MMTAWILESALRSLMMGAVVWAGIKLLRVRNVAVLKTAWVMVLVAAIALPALQHWNMPQMKAAVVVPIKIIHNATTTVTNPADVRGTALTILPASREVAAPVGHWSLSQWKSLLAPGYLAVCAILMLRLIVGLILACRIWSRAEDASVLLDPRSSVRISSDIETPVTIGSTIILPESYKEWDQRKLRVVLAHERSHVRQKDFYLQFLAGLYAAFFWFNPLSWWMKKEISDLGEAISDRAALAEAQSRSNYAEVLVEFAAIRRRPLAGVAMARSSNLRRRVDRLLIEQKFRNAFTACRWHLAVTLALVPLALVAAVALVYMQTADAMKMPPIVAQVPAIAAIPVSAAIPVHALARMADAVLPVHAVENQQQSETDAQSNTSHGSSFLHLSDDAQNSYAVVSGDANNISGSGDFGEAFNKVKAKMHGSYIWFERDGKSYVIDDPALVSQAQGYFKPVEELGRRQGELGKQQGELGAEQGRLGELQARASAPSPDLSKEMAELQVALKNLQQEKLQGDVKEEDLSNMQGKLAEVQGKLAEMQGKFGDVQAKIGEKQAEFGEQQAKLGEKQAELGKQQEALGAQQEQLSREATLKMKSLIDNAVQSGKARPVQ